jgi:hypothetical protein
VVPLAMAGVICVVEVGALPVPLQALTAITPIVTKMNKVLYLLIDISI